MVKLPLQRSAFSLKQLAHAIGAGLRGEGAYGMMRRMDRTNEMSRRWVFYSSLLTAGMIFFGCRPKEKSVEAAKESSLQPYDLVNTCAMVMSGNEVKGTGFFVSGSVSNAPVYFVTARHVAEKLTNHFAVWPRLELKVKRQDGNSAANVLVPVGKVTAQTYWHQKPSGNADLALFSVSNFTQITNEGCDLRVIRVSTEGTRDDTRDRLSGESARAEVGPLSVAAYPEFRVGEGHETVLFAASPELLKNASPREFLITVRRGSIAAVPRAVLQYYYGPTRLIILDCPVLAGNSGGPVFVWVSRTGDDCGLEVRVPKLLGVVSSMLQDRMIALPNENRIFLENSGLSFITPSDEVVETLRYLEGAEQNR